VTAIAMTDNPGDRNPDDCEPDDCEPATANQVITNGDGGSNVGRVTIAEDPARAARTMWALLEPVHAVTYFTPQARAAFEAAGLRGFWRGYFAGRSAPLGAVGAAPVYASFFGFARPMVERALPSVWDLADPQQVLAVRAEGARAALSDLIAGPGPGGVAPDAAADAGGTATAAGPDPVAEAASLCREAIESIEAAGRPLGAANAALPWPHEPLDALWQAATTVREHRGDGHVAALLVEGLDGCESLVWRAAIDSDRSVLQPVRGWSDEEWDAAAARLTARGWLDRAARATPEAHAAHARIEATTDALAAGPWRALGPEKTQRLAQILRPLSQAALGALPVPNPVGLAETAQVTA
jgi:hypothetical protein